MYKPNYDSKASTLIFEDIHSKEKNHFSGKINVFVCGGLQNPERMESLLGIKASFAIGAVNGYYRNSEFVAGQEIPFMKPSPDKPNLILTGVVWLNLTKKSLHLIDGIELKGNHRKATQLQIQIGEVKVIATTYVKKQG